MIRLTDSLPETDPLSAEAVRLRCLFETYRDDSAVLFWRQEPRGAVLSMADGNMTVWANGGDREELAEFIGLISPNSVFSDADTLQALGLLSGQTATVMCRKADIPGQTESDSATSRSYYTLFKACGLPLPDYPHFAVDLCRRLNRGTADGFFLEGKCAAVCFKTEKSALISGIGSLQKGFGTTALTAILQKNYGRTVLLCCQDAVQGFYEKNGFHARYRVGYWVKANEHNKFF